MRQAGESDRLALFKAALDGAERLLASGQPVSRKALSSIIEQLKYLIDLETGTCRDTSRMAGMTIGVLTAREIDDVGYKDLAELLYKATAAMRRR